MLVPEILGEDYALSSAATVLYYAVIPERHVHLEYPLVGVGAGPLRNLLVLNVLEATLVKANADGGAEPLLAVVGGQVAQLLDLELVALALVDVGERGLPQLRGDAGRGVQNVLKPGERGRQ